VNVRVTELHKTRQSNRGLASARPGPGTLDDFQLQNMMGQILYIKGIIEVPCRRLLSLLQARIFLFATVSRPVLGHT
jgi:hypothetical protein